MTRRPSPVIAASFAARRGVRTEDLVAKAIATGGTVFVFPGQSSCLTGGALAAVECAHAFRAQLRLCEDAFAEFVDWPLLGTVLCGAGCPRPDRPDVAPSVLFAVTVSLAAQWRAMGIHPDAVIGLALGEVAAAYVSGALSLRDAARVVTLCGNAIGAVPDTHCAEVDTLRQRLRVSLGGMRPRCADVPFISSVTGAGLDTSILDADYWFANLQQAGLFNEAVRWSCERGYRTFIECSPCPVLIPGIQKFLGEIASIT
ncbi:acyltransferase domain-containing protein [Mycobacterium sp. 23]|uniref:acyltransferase domain-containing protein n=1 Tax=Mycobacterium sp. 23 TaxID=3400424 RepID=UPI003AAE421B